MLIQVPGGGWSVNDKRGQGYPLMSRMVELGWICVSINYSRSPRNAWPAHIIDVKRGHATNWSSNMKSNPKGVKETDVSLNVLEEVATGK